MQRKDFSWVLVCGSGQDWYDWNLLDLWFNEPHSDNVAAMFCLSFDKGAVGSVDGRSCRVETLGDNLKGL